jgi:hypothetical protein
MDDYPIQALVESNVESQAPSELQEAKIQLPVPSPPNVPEEKESKFEAELAEQSEVSDLDNLSDGEVCYKPKSDSEVLMLHCKHDGRKYLAIRQRANYCKLHLLCRSRSLSKCVYLPLWHKPTRVDKTSEVSPGPGWSPYTVEIGDVWVLVKTLPPKTLTDWAVSRWLDQEVNPEKPLKSAGTNTLSGLSVWDRKLTEARELLDAVKEI